MLKFLLRVLLVVFVLGAASVVAYTFIGDLAPETEERRVPVELDAGG